MKPRITIAGAGCCLVDKIYPDIDFSGPAISQFISKRKSDGGLHPGRLVFSEQFEAFSVRSVESAVSVIAGGRGEPDYNVGGPSIVSLIHAAQLLQDQPAEVRFYGLRGNDPTGDYLQQKLEQTPVSLQYLIKTAGTTPSTIVLSDPSFHDGHGERMFINTIGAAHHFGPRDLNRSFFESGIVALGGTALVPGLHDHLSEILARAKESGAITVVNTVYDFRSEIERPGQRWLLGDSDESYRYTDLLIMDLDEALHLSGEQGVSEAVSFFRKKGVPSVIITNGTRDTVCYSDATLFGPVRSGNYPVSEALVSDLKGSRLGDTTGCGDNFVGGVIASLAWQILQGNEHPDLEECITWGTISGGHCCFHVGGTFIEMEKGEKLELLRPYYQRYREQIDG